MNSPSREPVCVWHQDEMDGMWETSCGHAFEFNDGSPKDNGFRFCGYCGKPLNESRTADGE